MPETRPYIPWDVITNFMKDAFMGYGVPERDAEICTDVLVESDRRGIESHGCNRFKPIYIDRFEQGSIFPVRTCRYKSFQTDLYRQVRTGNIEPCHKY